MKSKILLLATAFIFSQFSNKLFGQAPDLGTASGFTLFTSVGAFINTGVTSVTGDVGTGAGSFVPFPLGSHFGQVHVADPVSVQAATDVEAAFSYVGTLTCDSVIGVGLGNGQVLLPKIYCIGATATLNGNLILDGGGNSNAIFIFKINGALATGLAANVVLINGASIHNVYWQVNGQFDLNISAVFQGTLLVNGAINLQLNSSLNGRALSRAGAISIFNNMSLLPSLVDFGDLQAPDWVVAKSSTPGFQFLNDAPKVYNIVTNPYVSVWAGLKMSTEASTMNGGNLSANTDFFDDGLGIPAGSITGGYTYPFTVTANSNTTANAYYRLWFDWNADGNFSNDLDGNGNPATYTGIIQTASPTTVIINVKPPFGAMPNYKARLMVSDVNNTIAGILPDFYRNGITGAPTPTALVSLTNGEIEDYNAPAVLLPVTFNNINAIAINCNVYLAFDYLNQQNNKEFKIEYSATGTSWQQIALLPNEGNSGNKTFSFLHTNPAAGSNYYRIKQVDVDGNFNYSKTVQVSSNCVGANSIVSYPNPVHNLLTVILPTSFSSSAIIITDASGKVIKIINTQNAFNTINTSDIAAGSYMLQVTNNKKLVYNSKFVKQ